MNLTKLAAKCGKSVPFVMTTQKKFELPASKDYSEGYAVLISKLIYLSIAAVPLKEIQSLLKREKKLLQLLKADSVTNTRSWFEDLCAMKSGPTRLLLSGHDLGHVVTGASVQTGLDFAERPNELFGGQEMGDDALRAMKNYLDIQQRVVSCIEKELPTVSGALKWAHQVTG
jgi:hypothetical protein